MSSLKKLTEYKIGDEVIVYTPLRSIHAKGVIITKMEYMDVGYPTDLHTTAVFYISTDKGAQLYTSLDMTNGFFAVLDTNSMKKRKLDNEVRDWLS